MSDKQKYHQIAVGEKLLWKVELHRELVSEVYVLADNAELAEQETDALEDTLDPFD